MTQVNTKNANAGGYRLRELGADPSPPADGYRLLFAKVGGVYAIDAGGTVVGPLGAGAGGSAGAFTDLDDVPATYADEVGKFVIVNDTEDGLTFSDGSERFVVAQFVSEPSIADDTPTVLTWDNVLAGSTQIVDVFTNPTRMTLPRDGAYMVALSLAFADWGASPSRLRIEMYVGGNPYATLFDALVASDTAPVVSAVLPYVGSANDYIEFYVTQVTGGARTATYATTGSIAKM